METCKGFGLAWTELCVDVSGEYWIVMLVVGSWYCSGWPVWIETRKTPNHSVLTWRPERWHDTSDTGSNTSCSLYGPLPRMIAFHLPHASVSVFRNSSVRWS